jgi:hypothetical protein
LDLEAERSKCGQNKDSAKKEKDKPASGLMHCEDLKTKEKE